MENIQQRQSRLRQLCESLKQTDANLVDIIQFGSSVYAPDLARDIDLLVTTRSRENEDLYWDTFADLDLGADVIVRTPGQPMGRDIAASIRLMGNLLCGNGQTFQEAEEYMAVPTFERARITLETADTNLALAQQSVRIIAKDEYYKAAYDRLFDAARYAVIAYLNTDNARWGQLRHLLPSPFDQEFRSIINTLHIQYGYDGNYPQNDPDGAFAQWRQEVEQFIQKLEPAQSPTP
jgi:exonuclease VII small subunit